MKKFYFLLTVLFLGLTNMLYAQVDGAYDINVTAMSESSGIHAAIGEANLTNVRSLKVTGSINSYDIMIIRNKMPNLNVLDLSDASIVYNTYEYLSYNTHSSELANLHSNDNEIGNRMFYELTNLTEVKLPRNITKVGYQAFLGCSNLTSVTIYNGLKYIDMDAFNGCDIRSVVIPEGVTVIMNSAFSGNTNLSTVTFPSTLEEIKNAGFAQTAIENLNFPVGLKIIGSFAFSNCTKLRDVRLPSTVTKIESNAFGGTYLTDIYLYTIEPCRISSSFDANVVSGHDNYSLATLHVPAASYYKYYWDTGWSKFQNIVEHNEEYTYFFIDKDLELTDKRIEGQPDADLNPGSSLTVEGDEDQNLGDLNVISDGDTGTGASVIADDNINANWMKFEINVNANKWYFFAFPFNIKLSNIELDTKKEGAGEFVFRYYDGAERANNGHGGWKNLPVETEELKMGQGYIFQCNKKGTLLLKVEKPSFKAEDQGLALTDYEATSAQDAGWNFIGNPYISYYDINDTEYTAPITIWNGSSYEAIRPADDEYHFHPFEAFFVQKPKTVDEMTFTEENRTTYLKSKEQEIVAAARAMTRGADVNRQRIELTIADSEVRDKTRIVFNQDAKTGYETACDAAKFMSMENVPQIYSLDNESKYAINERPAGDVKLGYVAKSAGTFKIGIKRMDTSVQLYDQVTNMTVDLTEGDYAFETEEGTFENRFVVKASVGGGTGTGGTETGGTEASGDPVDETTGIASVKQQTGVSVMNDASGIYLSGVGDAEVYIYTMSGTMLAKNVQDGFVPLPKATYIVKVNKMAAKLMVK